MTSRIPTKRRPCFISSVQILTVSPNTCRGGVTKYVTSKLMENHSYMTFFSFVSFLNTNSQ